MTLGLPTHMCTYIDKNIMHTHIYIYTCDVYMIFPTGFTIFGYFEASGLCLAHFFRLSGQF